MSDGTNGAIITSTIRQETNRLPKSNKMAFVALSCLKKEKKKKSEVIPTTTMILLNNLLTKKLFFSYPQEEQYFIMYAG